MEEIFLEWHLKEIAIQKYEELLAKQIKYC